jgi:HEAT repeat protein
VAGKEAFERKLEALAALRTAPAKQAVEPLRKALKDRSNYVVSKAVAVAGEMRITELVSDLVRAFERFMTDPVKTDPQCWAKNAIVKALKDLHCDDPAVFLRGIGHVQMEAVWGGQVDTAVTLRGACALALVACALDRLTILTHLVSLLSDEALPARLDAVTALGQVPGADTVLLLRLKALLGDKEPEVTGRCFDVLLELAPEQSIPFVDRFLSGKDPDLQAEAVGALAGSRHPAAAKLLLPVIETGRAELAKAAIVSLAHSRFREEFRERIEAGVRRRDIAALTDAYRTEFPPLGS